MPAPHGAQYRLLTDGFAWELFGWPEPPLTWLERAIEGCFDGAEVHARWVSAKNDNQPP